MHRENLSKRSNSTVSNYKYKKRATMVGNLFIDVIQTKLNSPSKLKPLDMTKTKYGHLAVSPGIVRTKKKDSNQLIDLKEMKVKTKN